MPRLTPDSRIRLSKKKEATDKPTTIAYTATITTPPASPLRLISTYAKAPIPIALNLTFTPDGLGGSVRLGQFPLDFFRRDARVDHLTVALADPTSRSELDGRVDVNYADYTITILIYATAGRPRLILQSDPPLPQDQVISVLLFGEPVDELDTGEQSSVGSMAGAIADRAISLTSLYVLGSTPIKSIAYNPQSGAFSARLQIAPGTSLTYGSKPESYQQIGLRKRIGKNWVMTTYVQESADTQDYTGNAFIEWHKRY